jgi:hypothetical protein
MPFWVLVLPPPAGPVSTVMNTEFLSLIVFVSVLPYL